MAAENAKLKPQIVRVVVIGYMQLLASEFGKLRGLAFANLVEWLL